MSPNRLPSVFEDYVYPYSAKEKYFYLFNTFCSEYSFADQKFDFRLIDLLKEKYGHEPDFRIYKTHESYQSKEIKDRYKFLIILKKYWIIGINDYQAAVFYDINQEHSELEELKKLFLSCAIVKDECPSYYVIVKANHFEHEFDLEKCNVRNQDIEIETHYNDDFLPVDKKINEFIESEGSGLVILHGIQGTGKTSYIRHLIIHSQKRIIYLPVDMMNYLSDSNFLPFIMHYKNSILVIEDCEAMLQSRDTSKSLNPGLVNILNLTDGLLGDSIQLKLICTFNAPLTSIDKALLRKGRLKAMFEFKKLIPEKVNKLIEKYNLKMDKTNNELSLAEIFHYHEQGFDSVSEKKIGFEIR